MRYFVIFYVSYIGGLTFPSLAFAGSISEQLIRCANNVFKFCAVLITRKSNYSIFKFLRKDIVILSFFNLVCFFCLLQRSSKRLNLVCLGSRVHMKAFTKNLRWAKDCRETFLRA